MDRTENPANNNLSLSHFTKNKDRELAQGHIDQLTSLLLETNVPRAMIAETLFEKLTKIIVPKEELTSENATVWYSQLLRMRDALQNQITLIEEELDRTKSQ